MKTSFTKRNVSSLLIHLFITILLFNSAAIAQCNFTIPAVSGPSGASNYQYCGTTVYNTPKTTIAYYPTHYMWVCPGDTVDFVTDCCINPGNQQTGGAVILEPGAVFILEYGAAGWSVWARAGSQFINNTPYVNSYNDVIADPLAFVTAGFGSPGQHNNWCTPVNSASCPGLTYDYSLVTPGSGCATGPVIKGNQSPCGGNKYIYTTDAGKSNYVWTVSGGTIQSGGGTTDDSITVSWSAAPGTVTVNYSSGGSTTTLNITPVSSVTPSVTIAADPAGSICVGTSVTFTATPGNGGANPSYQWKKNSNVVSGNSNIYTDNSFSNNDIITCTITSDAACVSKDTASTEQVISITPAPAAGTVNTVADSVCSGTSASLHAGGSTGLIQWQSSADNISFADITGATGAYFTSPSLSQTTYYRVTAANNCGKDSSSASKIAVIEKPVAGTIQVPNDSVCMGAITHLELNGTPGNSLQWQSSLSGIGYNNIAGATDGSYTTGAVSQDIYYRVVASNGICNDTSSNLHITALPAPTAEFSDSAAGLNISFNSAGSSGASSYAWNFGDSTAVNSGPHPAHNYAEPGTYHVCLTVKNSSNCSFTICNNITIVNSGVMNINDSEYLVYPNPAEDNLVISTSGRRINMGSIEITDATGRKIFYRSIDATTDKLLINVSGFSAGIYFLKIIDGQSGYIQKIIKQ